MIRLASIVGVAAVATLVLMSGCETPMKTDYAKDLAGTWNTMLEDRQLGTPPNTVAGTTAVTAAVTRTGINKGTVALTVVDTPTGALMPISAIKVEGSIEVTADEINATDLKVDPPAALTELPEGVAAGLMAGLTLTYELSDDGNKLDVTNTTLFGVLLGPNNTTIKLTKEMGSN